MSIFERMTFPPYAFAEFPKIVQSPSGARKKALNIRDEVAILSEPSDGSEPTPADIEHQNAELAVKNKELEERLQARGDRLKELEAQAAKREAEAKAAAKSTTEAKIVLAAGKPSK